MRQIAVAAITVKQPARLMTVAIAGTDGSSVTSKLRLVAGGGWSWLSMGRPDRQQPDRRWPVCDPMMAIDHRRPVLSPVKYPLAGRGHAATVPAIEPGQLQAHAPMMPRLIMVDEVLASTRKAGSPLADRSRSMVNGPIARTAVRERRGKVLGEPDPPTTAKMRWQPT